MHNFISAHTFTPILSISTRYVVFSLLFIRHGKQGVAVGILYQSALMEKGGIVAYPRCLLHIVRHNNNGGTAFLVSPSALQ